MLPPEPPASDPPPPTPPSAEPPASEPAPLQPRPNRLEAWLIANIPALLTIVLALTLAVVLSAASAMRPVAPKPPPQLPAVTDAAPGMPTPVRLTPVMIVVIAAVVGGFLLFLGFLLAFVFSAEHQAQILAWLTQRMHPPQPALRVMDLLAVLAMAMFAATALGTVLQRLPWPSHFEKLAAMYLANVLVMGVGIATAVALARIRGGGPQGSAGLWPFWTLNPPRPDRSLWDDVKLGVLTYPLVQWFVLLCGALMAKFLSLTGRPLDEHEIVGVLRQQPPGWMLGVLFFVAVIGAALMEELLIRGVLYNVMKQYLAPWFSAVLASLTFVLLHSTQAHWLSLFVLAMIFTWLYEKTGRLVASMTLHAVNNLVSLLLALDLLRR